MMLPFDYFTEIKLAGTEKVWYVTLAALGFVLTIPTVIGAFFCMSESDWSTMGLLFLASILNFLIGLLSQQTLRKNRQLTQGKFLSQAIFALGGGALFLLGPKVGIGWFYPHIQMLLGFCALIIGISLLGIANLK